MSDGEMRCGIQLDTAAICYAGSISDAVLDPQRWARMKEHLRHAAINYAAEQGVLGADERGELLSLRRFREIVLSHRNELNESPGVVVVKHFVVETIDAALTMATQDGEA